jgi:hypothetical protein
LALPFRCFGVNNAGFAGACTRVHLGINP